MQRYQTLVESAKGRSPKLTKRDLLDMVVKSYEKAFSPRSLQPWIRKYELEGAANEPSVVPPGLGSAATARPQHFVLG